MIIFLAPDARAPRPGKGERLVRALPDLIHAAYSRLPEHSQARERVVELNHRSLQIAYSLHAALPDELHEFWDAYAGWFAMYSVAPLLGNMAVARQAIADLPPQPGSDP